MYKNKDLKFGFIVLCTEYNFGRLKSTINSIKNYYPQASYLATVSNAVSGKDIKEIKTLCPAYKGKATITSLMNVGLKNGNDDWNIFLMEGTWLRRGLVEKLSRFVEDEKDILYPIITDYDRQGKPVNRYTEFYTSTLNGIMIHKKTFLEIGNFTDDSLNLSRLIWLLEAVTKNAKFKGIAGVKFC